MDKVASGSVPRGSCDAAARDPGARPALGWRSPLPCPSQKFKKTFPMSPVIVPVKHGGWQLHYPPLQRFLHIMTLSSLSRAVSLVLIVVFPCNFWFSPCPSSPSAYSYPAETCARPSLPKCDPGSKAKCSMPPCVAPVQSDTPSGRKHGKKYSEPDFFPLSFFFFFFWNNHLIGA